MRSEALAKGRLFRKDSSMHIRLMTIAGCCLAFVFTLAVSGCGSSSSGGANGAAARDASAARDSSPTSATTGDSSAGADSTSASGGDSSTTTGDSGAAADDSGNSGAADSEGPGDSGELTTDAGNGPGVEVPGPSPALYANPFYTCVRTFYVSATGSDSNDGTSPAKAWATIQNADSSSRAPGDCIEVAPGTYNANVLITHGGNAPTPTGYIVYRCSQLDACHVLSPGPAGAHLWEFSGAGNFVVVDGFEVDGNNALLEDGAADSCFVTSDYMQTGFSGPLVAGAATHHLWIMNNVIHHCNLAGVGFGQKEWYYTIHNTVYHNAWTSGYQGSGIGYVVVQCIEAGGTNCYTSGSAGSYGYTPSGNDTAPFNPSGGAYTPFHNVVAWNSVYNNRIAPSNPVPCGSHTDGNGIIMDTFLDDFSNTLPYPYQTFVAHNVAFYNGARGIHIFGSAHITVASNTTFNNNTDTCIDGYRNGDLNASTRSYDGGVAGGDNTFVDNIAYGIQTTLHAPTGGGDNCEYCGTHNCGITSGGVTGNMLHNHWSNNIAYMDSVNSGSGYICMFQDDVTDFSCTNNECGTDPQLTAAMPGAAADMTGTPAGGAWTPGTGNFALTSASPAIGYGMTETYLPSTAVDDGACASALSTCPVPNAGF